jgi:spore photoproduct lyase
LVHQNLEKYWQQIGKPLQTRWSALFSGIKLSFSQQKILLDIFTDIKSWNEQDRLDIWPSEWKEHYKDKVLTQKVVQYYQELHQSLLKSPKQYAKVSQTAKRSAIHFGKIAEHEKVLGSCPVASEKTRCCNLLTLDVVRSCGFDCTYCSIQSFFNDDQVDIEHNLTKKLKGLNLDPNKHYHIGTGQSSDSLMWGNKDGILDELIQFARDNPNVILEFKTKSHNITYFLQNEIPKNILLTWSLNPQEVIDVEERLTSSLDQRLQAAKMVADRDILVGFHFHPIIYFDGYKDSYQRICQYLVDNFNENRVALVSLGTVTFTKKVIKKIRGRDIYTKILQMEMVDAEGKLSYPLDIKREIFSTVYQGLRPWHNKVYFYLCMEDKSLWMDVFEREYLSNDLFEQDMIKSYFDKVQSLP